MRNVVSYVFCGLLLLGISCGGDASQELSAVQANHSTVSPAVQSQNEATPTQSEESIELKPPPGDTERCGGCHYDSYYHACVKWCCISPHNGCVAVSCRC